MGVVLYAESGHHLVRSASWEILWRQVPVMGTLPCPAHRRTQSLGTLSQHDHVSHSDNTVTWPLHTGSQGPSWGLTSHYVTHCGPSTSGGLRMVSDMKADSITALPCHSQSPLCFPTWEQAGRTPGWLDGHPHVPSLISSPCKLVIWALHGTEARCMLLPPVVLAEGSLGTQSSFWTHLEGSHSLAHIP